MSEEEKTEDKKLIKKRKKQRESRRKPDKYWNKKTTNLKISKACELTGNPEKGKALKPEEIPQERKRASEDTLL
ncbi:MAG: hypothetical protein IJ839_00290 [Ruminobacter sp.]|nr:hypothetical protein [Ruminobacter sp.]